MGGLSYGSDFLSRWRRELRVCSPDIFPTYFRLGFPEGGITQVEMEAVLSLAEDPELFG